MGKSSSNPPEKKEPAKAKKLGDFKEIKAAINEDPFNSFSILSKKYKSGIWYHLRKENPKEAFLGDVIRILLGNHQPKVRMVNGYVTSKEVPGFKDFRTLTAGGKKPFTAKQLIDAQIIPYFAVAFLTKNIDLSGRNVGLDQEKRVIMIDLGYAMEPDIDFFKISEESIRNLIINKYFITDAWDGDKTLLTEIYSHKNYLPELYRFLMKVILIDQPILRVLANDHYPAEHPDKEKLPAYLAKRILDLEATLINIENFRGLLLKNEVAWKAEILADFKKHNDAIENKIKQLTERVKIFMDEKNDYKESLEYKKLIQKIGYQNLDAKQLAEVSRQKIREYIPRILPIENISEKFDAIVNQAKHFNKKLTIQPGK